MADSLIFTYTSPPEASQTLLISVDGQREDSTWALATADLTGISAYQWKSDGVDIDGATTSATPSLTGRAGEWISCSVTHDGGTSETPAVLIYEPCPPGCINAAHDIDDDAVLALCFHQHATHVAVSDGDWSTAATWSPVEVPPAGAVVLIPRGRTVTYDVAATAPRLDRVRVDGLLTFATDQSTQMLVETLIVTRGAELRIATSAARLSASHTAEIIISDRNYLTDPTQPTDIDITRDTRLWGRGVIWQGKFSAWGTERTRWLRTAADSAPMATDTSAVLSAAPTGWVAGDDIIIPGTLRADVWGLKTSSQTEARSITSVSGDTVNWSGGLSHPHDHQNSSVLRTDLQPAIGNLECNIVITSESLTPAHRRGHTMAMHKDSVTDLWDVRFKSLGRTVKSEDRDALEGIIDGDGDFYARTSTETIKRTLQATDNLQSRYPMHYHFVGFGKTTRDVVVNCVVDESPGWAMVHHACDADLFNNFMYDIAGAGMVSETGNETGAWVGNLMVKTRNSTNQVLKGVNFSQESFWKHGYGFAMRGRAMRVNGNMAMDIGSTAYAFFHRHPDNPLAPVIANRREDLDLKDLQVTYSTVMRIQDYPIIHFNNNEAAGISNGLAVSKAAPEQDHGVNVNLKNFKCWSHGATGIILEYIGQYAVTDADLVGTGANPSQLFPRGIAIGANTAQVALVRPRVQGQNVGIGLFDGEIFFNNSSFSNDEPRYTVVAAEYMGNNINTTVESEAIVVRTFDDEPTYVDPTVTLPRNLGNYNGSWSDAPVSGTLSDSLSSAGLIPKPVDRIGIPQGVTTEGLGTVNPNGFLGEYGYWTNGGDNVTIHAFYAADRITAKPVKSYHTVTWTGSVGSADNNGAFTFSENPPVVSSAVITTSAGSPATLDVIALATDADSDTMTLTNIYGQASYYAPDFGRLEINQPSAGSVRYTPDPGFVGTDLCYLFVDDNAGNATTVEVKIGVGLTTPAVVGTSDWSIADSATANAFDITLSDYPDSGNERFVSVEYTTDAGANWRKLYKNRGWKLDTYTITKESDGADITAGAYTVALRYVTDHTATTVAASTGKAVTVS